MSKIDEVFEKRFKKITEDQNLDFPMLISLNRLKPLLLTFFKLGVYLGQQKKEETEIKIDLGEPTNQFKEAVEELK